MKLERNNTEQNKINTLCNHWICLKSGNWPGEFPLLDFGTAVEGVSSVEG